MLLSDEDTSKASPLKKWKKMVNRYKIKYTVYDTAYKEESDNAYCAEGYDLYNIKCAVCKYIISNKDVDDIIVAIAS